MQSTAERHFRLLFLLIGMLVTLPAFGIACPPISAQPETGPVINPLSSFDVFVDAQFSGGTDVCGIPIGEWSDVTPRAFQSGPLPTSPATPVAVYDGDSLLFAALAGDPGAIDLYLMFSYEARTSRTFEVDKEIASVKFPVTVNSVQTNATVTIKSLTDQEFPDGSAPDSFFDVFVVLDNSDPCPTINCGIKAWMGFGGSYLNGNPHLLFELAVPLLIPDTFGGIFSGGIPGGVYAPGPATWNASAIDNLTDPPIASATIGIDPNGDTLVCPRPGPCPIDPAAVPEPAPLWLLGLGGLMLFGVARVRRRALAQQSSIRRSS